jgi:hypothetical protein
MVLLKWARSNFPTFQKLAHEYYFLVVLKNYHVQGAISIVLLHETPGTKSGCFVTEMS